MAFDYLGNNFSKMFVEEDMSVESTDMALLIEAQNFIPQTEEECLRKYANATMRDIDVFCHAAWDSLYCWPPVPGGTNITRPCAEIFPFLEGGFPQGYAFRECNESGKWFPENWTNYTACMEMWPLEKTFSPVTVSYIIFLGSIISLISLIISLFIFSYFKALQCSRIRVHRNLVISLILHSLMMLAISLPGIFESLIDELKNLDWFCKTILTVKTYAAMTCIYWMFVEGHLLHSSITVSVFQSEAPFRIYYAIGWGIPFVFVCSWVVVMAVFLNTPCWKGYGKSTFIWLITAPMMTALLVNTVFLINIIRILITKLRTSLSLETKQVRKAIKATALLFPLLGITHLLFCINPRDDSHLEHAYMITNAILQSSQGLFVAILYCFLNSEVQSAVMNSYLRSSMKRHPSRTFTTRSKFLGSFTNTTSLSQSNEHVNGSVTGGSSRLKQSLVPLQPVPENERSDSFCSEGYLLEKETSFIH